MMDNIFLSHSYILIFPPKSLFSITLILICITLSLVTLLGNNFSFHFIALRYKRNVISLIRSLSYTIHVNKVVSPPLQFLYSIDSSFGREKTAKNPQINVAQCSKLQPFQLLWQVKFVVSDYVFCQSQKLIYVHRKSCTFKKHTTMYITRPNTENHKP